MKHWIPQYCLMLDWWLYNTTTFKKIIRANSECSLPVFHISVTNVSTEPRQKIASPNTRGWCTGESLSIVHWDVENLSPSINRSIFMCEGKVSCNFQCGTCCVKFGYFLGNFTYSIGTVPSQPIKWTWWARKWKRGFPATLPNFGIRNARGKLICIIPCSTIPNHCLIGKCASFVDSKAW